MTESTDIHGEFRFFPCCGESMPYSMTHSCKRTLLSFNIDNVYNARNSYTCLGSLSPSPVRGSTHFSTSVDCFCQSTEKGISPSISAGEFSKKVVSSRNSNGIIRRNESEGKDESNMSCPPRRSSHDSIQTVVKTVFPEISLPESNNGFDVCKEDLKGLASSRDFSYFNYPSSGKHCFSMTNKTSKGGDEEKKRVDAWIKPLQEMSVDVERLRSRQEQLEKRHSEFNTFLQQKKRKYGNNILERNYLDDSDTYGNKCVDKPSPYEGKTADTDPNTNRSIFGDGQNSSYLSPSLTSSSSCSSSSSSSVSYVEILANPTLGKKCFEDVSVRRNKGFKSHFFTLCTN
ncbi:uncharacterized protein TM35_000092410 [Trypanosoma theileri]|uniref:Uncharacterized protein n=1 Tax=Trypanosoma theileri TaxID=67003 RepID=A0A1X0P017_9TRYP|nr:uncharacterized protein TM35_000092410 [Trypanosoma theileri]ORC90191.1 hypothetical protein TM35_000092410 [Trypanosoma theileri]